MSQKRHIGERRVLCVEQPKTLPEAENPVKEETKMKHIIAVIRPERLDDVRRALEKVGYSGLMISEIQGHGKQKGIVQQWRGEKYKVDLIPKVKLEVVVKDSELGAIKKTIIENARTGEIGDGKMFISTVDEVVRIRTGEEGEIAL